jgi:hypothetical protein
MYINKIEIKIIFDHCLTNNIIGFYALFFVEMLFIMVAYRATIFGNFIPFQNGCVYVGVLQIPKHSP